MARRKEKGGPPIFINGAVSGVVNEFLTAEVALRLGQAAGIVFQNGGHRHKVIVGKDPRISGYMLETAITAGFTSAGADVELTGPIPTPAVAMLVGSMRADLGVMITGSIAPYTENGIQMFDPCGGALSQEQTAKIEEVFYADTEKTARLLPTGEKIGKAHRIDGATDRYVEYVKGFFPDLNLEGLRIVVDCANGATYKVAPWALRELGAEIFVIGDTPSGTNINQSGGVEHLEVLQQAVHRHRADFGCAFSGGGSQVAVVDRDGKELEIAIPKDVDQPLVSDGLFRALWALAHSR